MVYSLSGWHGDGIFEWHVVIVRCVPLNATVIFSEKTRVLCDSMAWR